MNRLARLVFLSVVLLLPIGAVFWPLPAPLAPPAAPPPPPEYHFSIDAAAIVTPKEAAAIKASGAQLVRLLLSWAQVEPNPPDRALHVYDWSEPDTMLGILADQHLDVMLTIRENPAWAAPTPNGPVNPAYQQSYYDFVQAAAARYHAAPYTVREWEIYNEEDEADEFGHRAADYVAVLRQDYAIIKSIAPDARVMMGGMAYDNFAVFVQSFLPDFLAAGGAQYTDAINFHGYSNSSWGSLAATVGSIRQALAQAGVKKPLTWTEAGMSSSPQSGGSPEAQAAYVAKIYASAAGLHVSHTTWFPFQDFTTTIPGFVYFIHHGLTNQDGSTKPAYTAYQVAVDALTATTPLRIQASSEFSGGSGEGYSFARPDGGGLVVAWATGGSAQASWPAGHIQDVRDVYGQPVGYAQGQITDTVPLSGSPVYIELDTPSRFADVPLDRAGQPAIEALAAQGALSGYGDGTFRPAAAASRAQVVKALVVALGWPLAQSVSAHFRDVPPGDPFLPFVETAYEHQLISGYGDGRFRPLAPVTRAQLSRLLAQALGWPPVQSNGGPQDFADIPPTHPFYGPIEAVYARGGVGGYADGTFRPELPVTRAELAQMIGHALAARR